MNSIRSISSLSTGTGAPSALSRREWLARTGLGFGGIALADLLGNEACAEGGGLPGLPGLPHFAPKAKRVISLFMSGGVPQFESFDHKPKLKEMQDRGEMLPDSYIERGLLGMSRNQAAFQMAGSAFAFRQHGQCGRWVCDLWPETASVVDDLCFIHSLQSEAIHHDPALLIMASGSSLPGRPSMGSWITYGLGSENADLPGFIVLVSKRAVDHPLSSRLWDHGFLPGVHRGVPFHPAGDPVTHLGRPPGISPEADQRTMAGLRELHEIALDQRGERQIESRIQQFEMAFRMQMSVPEVTGTDNEPASVKELYGPDVERAGSFARHCLLARRLAERGVRSIHLHHPGWDLHGGIPGAMPGLAGEVDRGCAALIKDLKQRDLLKDTLVIWGSEFGRTPYSQGRIDSGGSYGRDHHRNGFTFWMAGAGLKPGFSYGQTCDIGFDVVENPVPVNDFHATVLERLGIRHEALTFSSQGRDFRLTDVAGKVITDILT